MRILDYAITNRLTPFISMQNYYCLIYREEEREMYPTLNVRPRLFVPNPPRALTHRTAIWRWLNPLVTPRPRPPDATGRRRLDARAERQVSAAPREVLPPD